MLTIKNLVVDYGEGAVLDGLALALDKGAVHGLVGKNGEGKSSLLNAVYGLVKPVSGEILWEARPILASDIAYLMTELYFYPMITGMEYLKLFQSQNPKFDIAGWNSLLELPLQDYIRTYSTGMRKKLALLGVLALDRPLLMLDEPFNGLDLETNLMLSKVIRMLAANGTTVLVTSHILESLTTLCDKIHWLRLGHVQRTFVPEDAHELKDELLGDLDRDKLPMLSKLIS